MSQNLIVSFATTKIRIAKAIVAGLYQSALAVEGQPATIQTSDTPEVTFAGVVDGEYTVTSSRVDNTGAPIGKVLVDVITIANGAVAVEQIVDGVDGTTFALVQVVDDVAPTAETPTA